MAERFDEHYVRSVVTMGDRRDVYTNQAIFTTNRIKLVEKDVRVDSEMFERLVSHKLIPKIDECLSVDNEITQRDLLDYARDLLENDPQLFLIRQEERRRRKILRAIEQIPLLPPLAFKLTVASEQRPEVYDHSVRMALVSLFLAAKYYFFSQKELANLAAAAVFHDLGILHIPPDLLAPGRQLEKSERHYLYTHPITGYLLLRRFPEYHPEISRTVFEHHERLDGSGYPRGLVADEICLGAQILMVAEIANSVFEQSATSWTVARLSVLLRINQSKLNADLCSRLISTLQGMATEEGQEPAHEQVDGEIAAFTESTVFERKLSEVELVFQRWHETAKPLLLASGDDEPASPFSIIAQRLEVLQHALYHAGIDWQDTALVAEIGREDQEALQELTLLVGETHWQLAEIIHEAQRRLEESDASDTRWHAPVMQWIDDSEKILHIA